MESMLTWQTISICLSLSTWHFSRQNKHVRRLYTLAELYTSRVGQAKLPKLVISKFNGLFADWPIFWSQCVEMIEKSIVTRMTKFTYLRQLLDDRVKKTTDALPHSAEGYNRAVMILRIHLGNRLKSSRPLTKDFTVPQTLATYH